MKTVKCTGNEDIALVYIAEDENGNYIEFVESVQPPIPREEKWVLIVSTLFGCPVACKFCDAGGNYGGRLTTDQIMYQIDVPIKKRYPDGKVPVNKFKIQFARMGEPAFNENVLEVLRTLPARYELPGLMPSVSTIGPAGCRKFFGELLNIKNTLYGNRFQMQFSIHSTDEEQRDWLIPVKKMSFSEISKYGNEFFRHGERKVTLNFALAKDSKLEPEVLAKYFDPDIFLVKITPVNPTYSAGRNKIETFFEDKRHDILLEKIAEKGYDCILSIGELEENQIGSNCGQFVKSHQDAVKKMECGYNRVSV